MLPCTGSGRGTKTPARENRRDFPSHNVVVCMGYPASREGFPDLQKEPRQPPATQYVPYFFTASKSALTFSGFASPEVPTSRIFYFTG